MRGEAEELVWRKKIQGSEVRFRRPIVLTNVRDFLGFAENYPVPVRCGHEQK
jgi:hypothetical protein